MQARSRTHRAWEVIGIVRALRTPLALGMAVVLWTALAGAALAASDGSLRWAAPTLHGVDSAPAIGTDGTIYVTTSDSLSATTAFQAFNRDGSLKWSVSYGATHMSSPALGPDGTIYFTGGRPGGNPTPCRLYATHPDGTLKWAYYLSDIGGEVSIGTDGTVYVGSMAGTFEAVGPDGVQRWYADLRISGSGGQMVYTSAVGADGTLYVAVGGYAGRLYAVTPAGIVKWYVPIDGFAVSQPAIGSDGTVYLGSSGFEGDWSLYAVGPDGTVKWKTMLTGYVQDPVVGPDDVVYATAYGSGEDQSLYAIGPDGTIKWRYAPYHSSPTPAAVGADGTVYVGTFGQLNALNPDGTVKWSVAVDGATSAPAIGADGTVYIGADVYQGAKALYAVNTTCGGLADSPWPMLGQDPWHSGNAGNRVLMPAAGAGGAVSPPEAVVLPMGGSRTFAFTPDAGYAIDDVLVDGESVGPVAAYAFTDVQSNHRIEAVFAAVAPPQPPAGPDPGAGSGTPPAAGSGTASFAVAGGTSVQAGHAVTFTPSYAGTGTPAAYVWDFGDGSTASTPTAQAVQHAYAAAGSVTVSLEVRSASGATLAAASAALEIAAAQPPAASGNGATQTPPAASTDTGGSSVLAPASAGSGSGGGGGGGGCVYDPSPTLSFDTLVLLAAGVAVLAIRGLGRRRDRRAGRTR